MKIAIIGGGAAGMMTAYLLDKAKHAVTVFERQNVLGGNIRTTNKNLKVPGLDKHLFLEAGVVEFSAGFHRFKKLMDELQVELIPIDIGTGLFFKNGKAVFSRIMINGNRQGFARLKALVNYYILPLPILPLILKLRKGREFLKHQSMQEILKSKSCASIWMKNLSMYSYSIPYEQMVDFPAELGISSIKDYVWAGWYKMKGGVYSYLEKILDRFSGKIILNASITKVRRTNNQVHIEWSKGESKKETLVFDKVVFATPPDKVLQILDDATEAERRRFGAWRVNYATTVIHTDDQFYKPYNIAKPSPFDFFETPKGWGYNAYLNNLCSTNASSPYFLSYNMESMFDPKKIVHVQKHDTPLYTVAAFRYRNEIIATNGENHTFHAGAYLSDGLHEGALVSAERVAQLMRNKVSE